MAAAAERMSVERATFARHVHAAFGDRVRITKDAEGWPMAPGRFGRLECRGAEWDTDEHRLYAFTDRRRMIPRLQAIPGVLPRQIGDTEAALSMAAGDTEAIRAVAALLQFRQRRVLTPEQAQRAAATLAKHRATSGAKSA